MLGHNNNKPRDDQRKVFHALYFNLILNIYLIKCSAAARLVIAQQLECERQRQKK